MRKFIWLGWLSIVSVSLFSLGFSEKERVFKDDALEYSVRVMLGQERGVIDQPKLDLVTHFDQKRPGIRSLVGIERLRNLEDLAIYDGSVTDLSPLRNLTKLKALTISSHGKVRNLEPLRGLKSLVTLVIYQSEVADLEPLSGLVGLKVLKIDFGRINSLDPVSRLNLEVASFWSNEIEWLPGDLNNWKNLKEISLDGNRITDASALLACQALESIDIQRNRIATIEWMKGLVNLKLVRVQGNATLKKIENTAFEVRYH